MRGDDDSAETQTTFLQGGAGGMEKVLVEGIKG